MKIASAAALVLATTVSTAFAATSAPFSYDPTAINGPHNWHKLPIADNQCDGKKNSPIAVRTSSCDRFEDYQFSSGTCLVRDLTFDLTDTGVKASYPSDGVCDRPIVEIPGIPGKYVALQFHIHTSSEHTIDGRFYAAELHTVHQEVDGNRYAVVGMMIQPDAVLENERFAELLVGWQAKYDGNRRWCGIEDGTVSTFGSNRRQLLQNVQGELKQHQQPQQQRKMQFTSFSPYDLIPQNATYYHYDGGLTTPPCSEVVWWNLADKPVSVTPQQYHQLVTQVLQYTDPNKDCKPGTNAAPGIGSTSRPVQPLNGRTVQRICPVGFVEGDSNDSNAESSAATASMRITGLAVAFIAVAFGAIAEIVL